MTRLRLDYTMREDLWRCGPLAHPPVVVVYVLAGIIAAVAQVCALGTKWDGPQWPPGQRLYWFPAVVFLVVGAWWLVTRCTVNRPAGMMSLRGLGLIHLTLGLAVFGAAADYDGPDQPWLVLLAPMAVASPILTVWVLRKRHFTRMEKFLAVILGTAATFLLPSVVVSELTGRPLD